MKIWVLILLVFPSCLMGTQEQSYRVGKEAGQAMLKKYSKIDASGVPHYQATKKQQQSWQASQKTDIAHLEKKSHEVAKQDKIGQFVIRGEQSRNRFMEVADGELVKRGTRLSIHASDIIGEKGELITTQSQARLPKRPLTVLCQSSRAPEKLSCIRYLKEPSVSVIPEKKSHYWCTSGKHRPDDSRCRAKRYYNPARVYQAKQVNVSAEEWRSECHGLEARREKGQCKKISQTCLDDKPHIISGEPITKPCWKYQVTYSCQYPVKISCEAFLKQGCLHIDSKCVNNVADKCYVWEQTLECPRIIEKDIKKTSKSLPVFGLDGKATPKEDSPNNELASAMAQLAIFEELGKSIGVQSSGRSNVLPIFTGMGSECGYYSLGYKNCCKVKGWGTDLKITDCSTDEKLLALKREKGLCTQVGQYRKKKLLGLSNKKYKTYCCFPSKLTRIVQEQGRAQLAIGWGAADKPDCRGLTPEELSRIDFNRLNLQEVFNDIVQKVKPQDMAQMDRKIKQRLMHMKTSVSAKEQRDAL